MIIKISIPGQDRNPDLSQYTGNHDGIFGGAEFRVNDGTKKADAWFVIEDADPEDATCEVPPNQVHFLTAEGSWRPDKLLSPAAEGFLSQFATVQTCHPTRMPTAEFKPPFLPWMINSNHGSIFSPHQRDVNFLMGMEYPKKQRPLSLFCSAQDWTPNHRLRFAFAEHLKNHFGDDIEWFGNGVNPLPEKWDGLISFERTIVLENRSDSGNFTEKILDPFLTMTVPIYWGAPDIEQFLPVPRQQQINIHSFAEATAQIEEIIGTPVLDSDKERLIAGRDLVLTDLHFLNRISEIARLRVAERAAKSVLTLEPKSAFAQGGGMGPTFRQRLDGKLYRRIVKPFLDRRAATRPELRS